MNSSSLRVHQGELGTLYPQLLVRAAGGSLVPCTRALAEVIPAGPLGFGPLGLTGAERAPIPRGGVGLSQIPDSPCGPASPGAHLHVLASSQAVLLASPTPVRCEEEEVVEASRWPLRAPPPGPWSCHVTLRESVLGSVLPLSSATTV